MDMCKSVEMKCRKPICVHCGSQKTVLVSNQKVKNIFIQEHKCRACGKMFCLSKNMGKELIKFIDKNAKVKPPIKRMSYPQDWPAYNEAKTNEKGQFIQILSELNSLLEVEYRNRRGHPNNNLQDMLFACAIKVHSQISSRRTVSELKLLKERGYIEQVPHFNTLLNYFNEKDLNPILRKLIWLSSLPLKKVEIDFAADSSGFSTSLFSRWFDHKWGKEKDKRVWRKAHVISGVKTNIITSVEVTDGNVGDSTQFPALVEATKKNFLIKEISADKAYSSRRNLKIVSDAGGLPFIPFKKNVTGRPFGIKIWRAMYDYSILYAEEFMQHYHKRSNAETVFHMLKSNFGNNVKSKTFTGQVNEILLKCLCHNICVLIQEMHEIGLEVNYCADRSLAQQIVI